MPEWSAAFFRPLHRQMVEGVAVCTVWDIAEIAEQPARVDELVRCLHEAFRQLGLQLRLRGPASSAGQPRLGTH